MAAVVTAVSPAEGQQPDLQDDVTLEEAPVQSESTGTKRFAANVDEESGRIDSTKRRRTSSLGPTSADLDTTANGDHPSLDATKAKATPPNPESQSRKRQRTVDERTRSRRLFAGLLGPAASSRGPRGNAVSTPLHNANGVGTSAAAAEDSVLARRRAIEKRKRCELEARDSNIQRLSAESAEESRLKRLRRQVGIERRAKERAWDAEMDRAGYLVTDARPKLYYKPWEMTEEDEDRIDEQRDAAKRRVQSDKEACEKRWEQAEQDILVEEESAKRRQVGEDDEDGKKSQADEDSQAQREDTSKREAGDPIESADGKHDYTDMNINEQRHQDADKELVVGGGAAQNGESTERQRSRSVSSDEGGDDAGEDTVMY